MLYTTNLVSLRNQNTGNKKKFKLIPHRTGFMVTLLHQYDYNSQKWYLPQKVLPSSI